MRKLKIAIVANSCWNIYNFRRELIRHLKMTGHQIVVIAPVDEYIHYLNDSYFTKHIPLKHLDSNKTSPIKDFLLLKELYFIYKQEKPDLVFQFTIKPNLYGSIGASLLNLKVVSTLTGLGFAFNNWKYRMIFSSIYKWALSFNKKVVFHNRDDQQLFIDKKWITPEKALVIPGSGVDTNKFKSYNVRKDNDNFIFLFAGRLLKDKGLREFVQAAMETKSIVKNVEFWVIGEYNASNPNSVSKDELLQWIESRSIKYFGHENEVRKYMNKADVLVLPSYREGLPRTILESMSMEKPIITSDVPGCRELVIQDWNGLKVQAREVHQLAEAMVRMYNCNDEQRSQMGKNSRQLVLEKYDLNIVLHAYDDLIEELFPTEIYSKQKFS